MEKSIDRIRNTYTYSFESNCGDTGNGVNAEIGIFDMLIRPFAYPQHNDSQRAILTLHSMYICSQTATDRASGSVNFDDSAYYVILNGLGLSNQINSTAKSCGKSRGNAFFIPNKDGGSDNAKSSIYQTTSGGEYAGPSVLCSNPTGTLLTFEIKSGDTGDRVIDDTDLYTVVNFSIELIPNDIVSGVR